MDENKDQKLALTDAERDDLLELAIDDLETPARPTPAAEGGFLTGKAFAYPGAF